MSQQPSVIDIRKRLAFVLREEHLETAYQHMLAFGGDPEIVVDCNDDTRRKYCSASEVACLQNKPGRRITHISLTTSLDANNETTLSFWRTDVPGEVNFRFCAKASEDRLAKLRDGIDEIIAETRPAYGALTSFRGLSCFVLMILVFSCIYRWWCTGTLSLLLFLLISAGVAVGAYVLALVVFPLGVFAMGLEAQKAETLQKWRWALGVGFLASLLASMVASLWPAGDQASMNAAFLENTVAPRRDYVATYQEFAAKRGNDPTDLQIHEFFAGHEGEQFELEGIVYDVRRTGSGVNVTLDCNIGERKTELKWCQFNGETDEALFTTLSKGDEVTVAGAMTDTGRLTECQMVSVVRRQEPAIAEESEVTLNPISFEDFSALFRRFKSECNGDPTNLQVALFFGKYAGSQFEWTGTVCEAYAYSDRIQVSIQPGRQSDDFRTRCYFDKNDENTSILSDVSKGDQLEVTGIMDDAGDLRGCKVNDIKKKSLEESDTKPETADPT